MLGPMRSPETAFVRAVPRLWRLGGLALVAVATCSLAMAAPASASYSAEATLTPSDEVGKSDLGAAVALSQDGNTALVGGPGDSNEIGAAWVFVRRGSTWREQAKLTGKDEAGKGKFGTSVALSSDGKTALIGGQADNGGLGAAWAFTRSGPNWHQRGAKLVGKDAGGTEQEAHCDHIEVLPWQGAQAETYCFVGHPAAFGASVTLSSNATTALIGGPGDNEGDGAAWAFTRSGSTWEQQGEKLTGGGEQNEEIGGNGEHHYAGGGFGKSVALSSGGDTALIGGPYDRTEYYEGGYDESGGAVWTFTRSGSTWTQQREKLAKYSVGLGAATSLSPDGNTALIGSSTDAFNESAAGVFARSGSTWTRQSELGSPYESFQRGFVVVARGLALSSDGSTALVNGAANGDAWDLSESVPAAEVFRRSGKTWIEELSPTLEAPPGACGFTRGYIDQVRETDCGVALSADAGTALVGSTVFIPAPVPVVTGVSPREGREVGGTSVNITGGNFTNATEVKFGSVGATSFTINSNGSITAVSPPDSGRVDLTVANPYGSSLPWPGDRFRYLPPSPPTVVPEVASAITLDSAVLHATVTPNGASVEACRFEYGTEAQRFFGEAFSSVPCKVPGSGETPVAVSASVRGLSPFVRYVWRAVATNRSGTESSEGPSFVTSP